MEESSNAKTLTSSKINSTQPNIVNGNDSSHSLVDSRKPPSTSLAQKTPYDQAAVSTSRGVFDRKRYHSTPPESSVGPLKSTPPLASLADSRQQPIAVGVASLSSSSGHGVGMYSRHRINSDTAASVRPQSPHSPLLTKLASLHLTGVIERQREKEKSCTPSPCTPSQSKFSFPLLDVDDSSSSTSRETETTLTSEKAKQMGSSDPSTASLASTISSLSASDSSQPHQQPKAFAEGLKFVDTPDDHDDGPDTNTRPTTATSITTTTMTSITKAAPHTEKATTAVTPSTTTVGKAPVKTQIVFRPIDEVHDEDITVISGCKFFDPSQSQTDYYTPPPPLHHISSISKGKAENEVSDGKDKGKKLNSKESKSPLRQKRKNSSDKALEVTPEPKEKEKSGEEASKGERKLSKRKKEEKPGKKLGPKKKRSISMSEADVGTGSLPSLANPITKPPLPASATRKGYSSFRGDLRDHSASPDSSGLSKCSMPDLTSPVHSGSRGTTPDSSMSESEDNKRKTSLRKKLKSFMGKDKSSGKAMKTSWRFSDIGGVAQSDSDVVVALKGFRKLDEEDEDEANTLQNRTPSLNSTGSASQLSLMTHKDRLTMLEDTEIVPRTYSMECIYPTYNERCVDVPAIGEKIETKPKSSLSSSSSGSEYLTASDSGSVTKVTPEAEKEQRLSVPVTVSSTNLSQETISSDKFLTPPESSGHSQTSLELSVMGIMDKALNSADSATNSKPTSSSKLVSPLTKSNAKESAAGSSSVKVSSPRESPISGRKSSNRLSSPLTSRRGSGTSSPGGSKKPSTSSITAPHSPSPTKKSGSGTNLSSRTSPITTRRGVAEKKLTTSPLTQRRAMASPGSSPITVRKSASTRSTLSSSTSPLTTRRASSVRGTSSASPKSSPSMKRKVTPGSSRTPSLKPSPPMLSKTSLDSTSPSKPSQRLSSFSRFTPGRTPIKVKSIKENESTAEKVQRMREKRRSLADSKLLADSASCPTTPQLSGSKSRPKVTPPSSLSLSQPSAGSVEPESPHASSGSSSPTTPRRRRLGVSMPESPLIEIPPTLPEVRTPSPSAQPEGESNVEEKEGSTLHVVSSAPQLASSADLGFDLDSLLSSVGAKLDQMAEEEGEVKQLLKLQPVGAPPDIASMPAMVFSSPVHSRGSSFDIEGEISLPTSPMDTTTTAVAKQKLSAPLPSTGRSKSPTSDRKAKSPSSVAPKSPVAARKTTESSAPGSKKSKSGSGLKGLKSRLSVPSKGGKDQLSPVLEKKETPTPSPITTRKKKASADPAVPSSLSTSTAKVESQKFTSARPPRPPMMSRLPSDPSVQPRRISSADKPPAPPTTSSTGQKRPRAVAGRPSTASASKLPPSSANSSSSSSDVLKSKSSSALSTGSNKSLPGRSGLRASTRSKKMSTAALSSSKDPKASLAAESSLRRVSVGRQSMKTKSASQLRPGSATTAASRRGSGATEVEKPLAQRSMRRVSSGELLPRKIKPGASATLARERRMSQATTGIGGSSFYASGRASTLSRPNSASTAGFARTSVTRSMRLTRGSTGRKSTTTPPRAPMLTRKASPASTSALVSPKRKNSLRRTSSGGEVLAAFDHISAQAQGSM